MVAQTRLFLHTTAIQDTILRTYLQLGLICCLVQAMCTAGEAISGMHKFQTMSSGYNPPGGSDWV